MFFSKHKEKFVVVKNENEIENEEQRSFRDLVRTTHRVRILPLLTWRQHLVGKITTHNSHNTALSTTRALARVGTRSLGSLAPLSP